MRFYVHFPTPPAGDAMKTLTTLLAASFLVVAAVVAGCDIGAPARADLDRSPLYAAHDKPVTGTPGTGLVPGDSTITMTADRDTSGYE